MNEEKKTSITYEPAHDKTYNKTCATSEDSDQPTHPRRLIKVFVDRMCLLRLPGFSKEDEREPLPYWVAVQADLSLCWLHQSYCRFLLCAGHICVVQLSRESNQLQMY